MLDLIKFYMINFKLSKRKFINSMKLINDIHKQKMDNSSILIQKISRGRIFRKQNKNLTEMSEKKGKHAITTIQKLTRGM
jgi:hypothetical protein